MLPPDLANASYPLRAEVSGACEILGLDPLYVANEGKLVVMRSLVGGTRVVTMLAWEQLRRIC